MESQRIQREEISKHIWPNKRSDKLVKLRLLINGLAALHLYFVICVILSIDLTKAKDPRLWSYQTNKWKLITCWTNLILVVYYPLSVYCDWRLLREKHNLNHVKKLNNIRDFIFCSILFPSLSYAGILFWRLWMKNREYLCPPTVDEIVPFWTHHSMHTVPLVVAVLDLILKPRERPKTLKPSVILLCCFLSSYTLLVIYEIIQGNYIYGFMGMVSMFKLALFTIALYCDHLFYFYTQWFILDLIRSKKKDHKKVV